MSEEQTGLLIIRTWFEEGSAKPLRAAIRCTTDVTRGLQRELTLADVDDVCAEVRRWLAQMATD